MDDPIIFHLDLNAFFASVEQLANPRLRGQPVIVAGNRTTRTVAATASYEARRFGVTTGMPLAEARRRCPQAIIVEGTPMKYVDTSRRIFALLTRWTPHVEVMSVDEAFLDLTGTLPFFGSVEQVALDMKQRIRELCGLTCSIGIAPNKLLAKLASGRQKPDGLVQITQAQAPALLEHLPVTELCGIGERLAARLRTCGLTTCGALGRAPDRVLAEQFGIIGPLLGAMGRGEGETTVRPFTDEVPAKSMGHSHTLARDTWDEEVIRATILTLAEKVGRRLREDRSQGRTVTLTLREADWTTHAHHGTSPAWMDDGYAIYRAAARLLDRWTRRRPIRMVGVSVLNLVRDGRQMEFLAAPVEAPALRQAVDAINDRFGEFTVARGSVMAHQIARDHYQLKAVRGRLVPRTELAR